MSEKIYLSVVIPAYNEEKRISQTLLAIDKYLSKQDYSYEILVVDDGSKDKTVEIIKKLEKMIGNLKVIANDRNHGKGYVVRQAMLEAGGQNRLFTDADNSTSIEQVEKLLPHLKPKGEADIVIGSRGLPGSVVKIPQPFYRVILGRLSNLLIQIVALWGIWDSQCGFKLFSLKAAEKVFPKQKITRWGFDIEILAIAKKQGLKIKEVPIVWQNAPESKVSIGAYFSTFKELFKVKWNLIRGKYN